MSKEALKMGLEALKNEKALNDAVGVVVDATDEAVKALEQALAKQEKNPEWMTEEEQTAYTFGWFKALEAQRLTQQEQGEKSPPEQWRECWYGSGSEKGWWVVCGRNRIAHLGVQVSSDEVSKVVDAHNRYKPMVQPKEQEQGEPVAWMHPNWPDGYSGFQSPVTTYMTNGWIPLYTTPPPCPTCEALARTVMLDQTSYDTTPQQRTWVGLTDEEAQWLYDNCRTSASLIDMTEAKLREKNNG